MKTLLDPNAFKKHVSSQGLSYRKIVDQIENESLTEDILKKHVSIGRPIEQEIVNQLAVILKCSTNDITLFHEHDDFHSIQANDLLEAEKIIKKYNTKIYSVYGDTIYYTTKLEWVSQLATWVDSVYEIYMQASNSKQDWMKKAVSVINQLTEYTDLLNTLPPKISNYIYETNNSFTHHIDGSGDKIPIESFVFRTFIIISILTKKITDIHLLASMAELHQIKSKKYYNLREMAIKFSLLENDIVILSEQNIPSKVIDTSVILALLSFNIAIMKNCVEGLRGNDIDCQLLNLAPYSKVYRRNTRLVDNLSNHMNIGGNSNFELYSYSINYDFLLPIKMSIYPILSKDIKGNKLYHNKIIPLTASMNAGKNKNVSNVSKAEQINDNTQEMPQTGITPNDLRNEFNQLKTSLSHDISNAIVTALQQLQKNPNYQNPDSQTQDSQTQDYQTPFEREFDNVNLTDEPDYDDDDNTF